MTEAELNLSLAKALFPDCTIKPPVHEKDSVLLSGGGKGITIFNYRNWNDLMPHVIEHGIELLLEQGQWVACWGEPVQIEDNDPQRALAKCLLAVMKKSPD